MKYIQLFSSGLVAALLVSCVSAPQLEKDQQTRGGTNSVAIAKEDSAPPSNGWPGPQSDGSVLLPNMWSLRPVGRQFQLGDFPVNMAVHPSGNWVAILHSGHSQHEIIVIDTRSGEMTSRAPVEEAFYGISFAPQGKRIYCSGASEEALHSFEFAKGYLSDHQVIQLRDVKLRGIPAGICLPKSGDSIFVANVWGQSVTRLDVVQPTDKSGSVEFKTKEFPLSTNWAVARPNLPIPSANPDEAAISKRAEAVLDAANANDPFPYTCVYDEGRKRLYVSLWAQSAVAVLNPMTGERTAVWRVEEHPNEMLLSKNGKFLFVANANRNTVSVLDAESGRLVETLLAELQPNSPPGLTPNSLALSPDEKLLFVANANINAVAVFNVSEIGKSRALGFIPVGWYPTSARVTPDGKKLLITNGKGLLPKSNRHGPQPGLSYPGGTQEYIGSLFRGTLSIIDLPQGARFDELMKIWTSRAYEGMPKDQRQIPPERLANNPIPIRQGLPSPIKHCIYIIKENRTYDQVFGDMPQGKGDATLCLFGEKITPNHHALAREFVLLDNFYVESEVSADGHEWTMGAYATDFVEKSWPMSYGHNKRGKYPYPAEGNFAIAVPSGGYIWDRAKEAGITYRSFGEFVVNGKTPNDPGTTRLPALKGHFDPHFRSFDVDYLDQKRADRFIEELHRFEKEGEMPRLITLRLPNDHTAGTSANKHTPSAMIADNDLALGRVVEAVSHSKFWAETAIFVVEDDAQNGPDHIDAHRTVALAISPYARRGTVDSMMYSTSSMLRTMELILGLKPMSQFDAAALPMFNSFQSKSDLKPYKARPANLDLSRKNGMAAWGRETSEKMNFAKEDAADDLALNEIVWRSVKGADSKMPAPTRAGFVFVKRQNGDDDD